MNKVLLKQMVDEKLVLVQKHPKANLFIYNYSQKVQYDKLWNEITLQTRGLILDEDLNIVAKPFSKFFNLDEHRPEEIPNLAFEVFEKMDGTLGILYWLHDMPYIATRGSFESEQSIHATNLLYSRYKDSFNKLDKNATYLFEIIYPKNRLVVDYGSMNDLILLTIIDNDTGTERIEDIGFPMVKRINGINDLQQLKRFEEENKEGFVVRFKNGFRVKVKFIEYVRLHKIITGVSNTAIWDYMKEGKPFDGLLQKVPDEFYAWFMHTANELRMNYNLIFNKAQKSYAELYDSDKKTFALRVLDKAKDFSSILFNMYDGKKIEPLIWKMIKPKYEKPFKEKRDA